MSKVIVAAASSASTPGEMGLFEGFVSFAQAVQPIVLIGAGLWGIYVYRVGRRAEVRVGIQASCRLIRDWNPARSVLLVKLRIANTSSVLYQHREAMAMLFDARKESSRGGVQLVPFSRADPVPPVYGDLVSDPEELAAGNAFVLGETDYVTLEPGEHFDSEVAFVLRTEKLGLMALRVLLRGYQRRWRWWRFREEPYWWGSFLFVDPSTMKVSEPSIEEAEQRASSGKK